MSSDDTTNSTVTMVQPSSGRVFCVDNGEINDINAKI